HDDHALETIGEACAEMRLGEGDYRAVHQEPAPERIGHRAGLLVDLLQHEVLVSALLGHGRVPVDARGRPLHPTPVEGHELEAGAGDPGHLAILEDHDLPRVGEYGGGVGTPEKL